MGCFLDPVTVLVKRLAGSGSMPPYRTGETPAPLKALTLIRGRRTIQPHNNDASRYELHNFPLSCPLPTRGH